MMLGHADPTAYHIITTVVVPCDNKWMSMPRKEMKIKQKRKGIEWNYTYRQSRFMKETKNVKQIDIIASGPNETYPRARGKGRSGSTCKMHAAATKKQERK